MEIKILVKSKSREKEREKQRERERETGVGKNRFFSEVKKITVEYFTGNKLKLLEVDRKRSQQDI